MSNERVVVVDDDPLILRLVRMHLDKAGFKVLTAMDGEQGLDLVGTEQPDLVILDLMLPKIDGYEVCRRIREFSLVPVVMLTAKGEQVDKLRGFEMGADDYLTKPFAPQELLARVQAVLRRSQQGAPPAAASVIQCGDITIDLVRRRVTSRGEVVKLTPTEFKLLQQLALNVGKVLSHTDLLTKVWGPEYRDDRDYLWAYIRHLRRKLEPDPDRPIHILSEPGVGYVMEYTPA
ncbi:MAG: response regulator transcription factor [Chloroflexi bacterium]|nr:response regulator transcription factor [Chloroflexota bacterium]